MVSPTDQSLSWPAEQRWLSPAGELWRPFDHTPHAAFAIHFRDGVRSSVKQIADAPSPFSIRDASHPSPIAAAPERSLSALPLQFPPVTRNLTAVFERSI